MIARTEQVIKKDEPIITGPMLFKADNSSEEFPTIQEPASSITVEPFKPKLSKLRVSDSQTIRKAKAKKVKREAKKDRQWFNKECIKN